MKQISVAVLGCGNRGQCYTELMLEQRDKYSVVAFCDSCQSQLDNMHSLFDTDALDYIDEEEFFKEKRADVIVISTPDRCHVRQATRALYLGYDVLLEKPISDCREELDELLKAYRETGRTVMVCHVLRYGPAYRRLKELIDAGNIGRLYAIDASERVVYWHWSQAYVRGIGALLANGHPTILAKCSHDLDLIQYYASSKCATVSSIGELGFFTPDNAPEGSTERCLDCPHAESCPYSAKRIYIDKWIEQGKPRFMWPFYRACTTDPITEEGLYQGLRDGDFGRCAFRCPVDNVDHQFVQMQFENGIKASLKMVYAAEHGRRIVFYGTMGEIVYDERFGEITVMPFGKDKWVIDTATIIEKGHAHGGGDSKIVDELYGMLTGTLDAVTDLERSVECHLMGISAEESRKAGGALVTVHR